MFPCWPCLSFWWLFVLVCCCRRVLYHISVYSVNTQNNTKRKYFSLPFFGRFPFHFRSLTLLTLLTFVSGVSGSRRLLTTDMTGDTLKSVSPCQCHCCQFTNALRVMSCQSIPRSVRSSPSVLMVGARMYSAYTVQYTNGKSMQNVVRRRGRGSRECLRVARVCASGGSSGRSRQSRRLGWRRSGRGSLPDAHRRGRMRVESCDNLVTIKGTAR